MKKDFAYLSALMRYQKFGAKRLAYLRNFFDSWQSAFQAGLDQLIEAGIKPKIAQDFVRQRPTIDPERELELLKRYQIKMIPFGTPGYPEKLATIFDPPAALFVRGNLPLVSNLYFSVVGTRKPTRYGEQAVYELVPELTQAGLTIVSGLAIGIDCLVHQSALSANGSTVAVLPGGLDNESIVPKMNLGLAEQIIASGGALLSEFPPQTNTFKGSFPFRNRIISGLSGGTLVIEAAPRSGSLITAKCAIEQGRDVFAVPGPINALASAGTNNLIKMGAVPTTETADILGHYAISGQTATTAPAKPDNDTEKIIWENLGREPIHIDRITKASKLPAGQVSGALLLMEMKGLVRHLGGMYYTRNNLA